MMQFAIYTVVDQKEKVLVRWTEREILDVAEERFGKEKAKVLKDIMYEFKLETLTIP
jgi:hypothetical protein